MKRNYKLVSYFGEEKHFENIKAPSSVKYWQDKAKLEERDGYKVKITYEYDSFYKEVIMTKYYSYNSKGKRAISITLKK